MRSSKGGSGFAMRKRRRRNGTRAGIVIPSLIARSRKDANRPKECITWKKRKRFLLNATKKGKRISTVEHQK
jgi:hypothetical protein